MYIVWARYLRDIQAISNNFILL